MELTNATIDELLSLELAVSIAYEKTKQAGMKDHASNLKVWVERIREAKMDIHFEQTKLY